MLVSPHFMDDDSKVLRGSVTESRSMASQQQSWEANPCSPGLQPTLQPYVKQLKGKNAFSVMGLNAITFTFCLLEMQPTNVFIFPMVPLPLHTLFWAIKKRKGSFGRPLLGALQSPFPRPTTPPPNLNLPSRSRSIMTLHIMLKKVSRSKIINKVTIWPGLPRWFRR